MRRVWLSVVGLLLITMPSFGQSKSADSQTLESILEQVRQLRHDLQTTTLAAQKAQILIHRVDAEESVVRVMQDRVDTARSGLAQIRFDQKKRADTIKQIEDQKSSNDNPTAGQKELDDALTQIKARLETSANEEQEAQAKLTDAEEQLRLEQAKLSGLEDQLDRLEKSLENLDHGPE